MDTTVAPTSGPATDAADEPPSGIVWTYPALRFSAFSKRLRIGRAVECDVQLPSDQVSRTHAEIRRAGQAVLITDLGSRNGVHLNAIKVNEAPLSPGDVLRIGDWLGIVGAAADADNPLGLMRPVPFAGTRLSKVLGKAQRAAASDIPLIVVGETGTGKEVVSRAIHQWSGRSGRFVPVNCASLPENLAEGALFGYRKGAYTGADRDSVGFFRAAHRGTLLLDEIGDLSLSVQAKLLRVLEEGSVTPLGDSHAVQVDVRVIVAGQPDLLRRVKCGAFRSDLYARLQGLEFELPPLRERREEILPVFLAQLRTELGGEPPRLRGELVERLALYPWPLNVREVVQLARQMAILHGHERTLDQAQLPERFAQHDAAAEVSPPSSATAVSRQAKANRRAQTRHQRQLELQGLLKALEIHSGNVSKAAAAVGVSRRQAYRLLDGRPELNLAKMRSSKAT